MKVISDFDLEFANHKMPALVVAEFRRAQSARMGQISEAARSYL